MEEEGGVWKSGVEDAGGFVGGGEEKEKRTMKTEAGCFPHKK